SKEIPNSYWVNQYDNLSNRKAHYLTTGPEIWEQTNGKITHFIVGVGTGGTISGVGKYLKEKNPDIKIWGADTYGSVFKKYHETGEFDENEIYPYITEGIGEDILPDNVDFKVIDRFEKVTDKDGALYTRDLARMEGLFLGYSAGSAWGVVEKMKYELDEDSVVVVLFHDHGSRYVGKVFNDDWMRDRGFLNDEKKTASDLIASHASLPLVTVNSSELVSHAIGKMKQYNISQLPVIEGGKFVGSLDQNTVFKMITEDRSASDIKIAEVMSQPFPEVDPNTTIDHISGLITKEVPAVLVANGEGHHIITMHDLIGGIA
ncbi:MAG: pyridoxal-phosphate dependent enzyme, partial [Flavobacteriales bacterium]|nr:pyridoxal-phosphate dependent enzyme [Flavobacteriales bacterium]